ncbi:MAG: Asp-tRNA(Asn)/Glu-tRNA(Gln) amidotransferase subunit GatB [Gammaproteobacteria bacterium]|nr:Asp-tRNA(Asn)/Glu-tRNA(Gln) amidotransferase subunit GatB [Gammaproteobacteria bacterium]
MSWEAVIGLEVHVQLATNSKIFSGSATAYGAPPNTQASLIDLGSPGVLPVLNRQAVLMAVRFGLAIDAVINQRSVFARKNYFYPDLPKGYQISQYEIPIVGAGHLQINDADGNAREIRITRAHLEEDAGKSIHDEREASSGIDLNRAGTPLLEVVTEPDMRSAGEAVAVLRKLHSLVRYLDVCDGNMQEGSFRCDANVSIRRQGAEAYGTRAEIKNLNSFRFIEKAINFEIERQSEVLESGGSVVQETRLYDAARDETRPMRSKEEANDYRYFPDPDLLPVVIDDATIADIRAALPELPDAKMQRLQSSLGLSAYDAQVLTSNKATAYYFEALAAQLPGHEKLAANWVLGELTAMLNKHDLDEEHSRVSPAQLAGLLQRIVDQTISGKIAKDVFEAMWDGEGNADEIIAAKGLQQITDTSALEGVIDEVVEGNPKQLEQYRQGKQQLLGYFVGQVMKATAGKANPAEVNRLLKIRLDASP